MASSDGGALLGDPSRHAAVEVGHVIALGREESGGLGAASAAAADSDDGTAAVELAGAGGQLTQWDVGAAGDPAPGEFAGFADVQQDGLGAVGGLGGGELEDLRVHGPLQGWWRSGEGQEQSLELTQVDLARLAVLVDGAVAHPGGDDGETGLA